MALTNRLLALCSITTELVARATSRPGGLGSSALASPHWLLAQTLTEQPSLAQGGYDGE